jgi:TIR domain
MPKIAISYRRKDSDAITGRIRDRMARQFGDNSVFMDIDNIPLGTDFRRQIQEVLRENQILLVVIGPNWTGPVQGAPARIFDLADPVRIEVETALQRSIPTIPILVGGATMPSASELPESLKDLPFYNAAEVSSGVDFHPHVDRLIRAMEQILKGTSSFKFEAPTAPATGPASFMQRPRLRWAMISGLAVIAAAAIAYEVATLPRRPSSVSVTGPGGSPPQLNPPALAASPARSQAPSTAPTPSQPVAPAATEPPAQRPTPTVPALGAASSPEATKPDATTAQPSGTEAFQAWMATKDTTSQAILQDFIRQFGTTPYGSMARARLKELQAAVPKQPDKVAVGNPAAPPTGHSESMTSDDYQTRLENMLGNPAAPPTD